MKRFFAVTMLCGVLVACFDKSERNDFAGFSFDSSRKSLEAKGFICKDGTKDIDWECIDLDWTGTVFGKKVNKAKVGALKRGGAFISVDLVDVPRLLLDHLALESEVDSVHKRMKEYDLSNSAVYMRSWMRENGSTVKLVYFTGIGGILAPTATFTAISK